MLQKRIVFAFLLKPRPYPAFVLIAVIAAMSGAAALRINRVLGFGLILIAGVLVAVFVRSVVIDVSVNKVGVETTAHVTRVERKSGVAQGQTYDVIWVHFRFNDSAGATHEEVMVLEGPEAERHAEGESVRVRYHPDYPSVWRWLD